MCRAPFVPQPVSLLLSATLYRCGFGCGLACRSSKAPYEQKDEIELGKKKIDPEPLRTRKPVSRSGYMVWVIERRAKDGEGMSLCVQLRSSQTDKEKCIIGKNRLGHFGGIGEFGEGGVARRC